MDLVKSSQTNIFQRLESFKIVILNIKITDVSLAIKVIQVNLQYHPRGQAYNATRAEEQQNLTGYMEETTSRDLGS